MNYKRIGMSVAAAALMVSIIVPALVPAKENVRIHQHLEENKKTECTLSHADGELCTALPLVVIETGGKEIPGKPLGRTKVDENGNQVTSYYQTTEDGQTRLDAKMQVIDNADCYNHFGDTPALESNISIRVRGRSSRYFSKSSYSVKLLNEDGTNNKQRVMGMDAHHDWALHGPYLDKTAMRNYMFMNISGEIMDYAPNVRYCEVILDGKYQGIYVMMETITAGEDGARLNLKVDKKASSFSSYLVRLDSNHEQKKAIDTFTQYTYRKETQMEVVFPGTLQLTEEMQENICEDFSAFEKMLYSYDYNDKKEGYQNYIDVESFIDAFLINEITGNYDFTSLSTYIYKDTDGLFRVCVWDFNNSCDNFNTEFGWKGFNLLQGVWYVMLLRDEDFTEQLIDRYYVLRESYFSDAYIRDYIEKTAAFIEPAIKRDRVRWETEYTVGNGHLRDPKRNPKTYEEALEQLQDYLLHRLAWMDENIETLRQYSAGSKIKKYTETPY